MDESYAGSLMHEIALNLNSDFESIDITGTLVPVQQTVFMHFEALAHLLAV